MKLEKKKLTAAVCIVLAGIVAAGGIYGYARKTGGKSDSLFSLGEKNLVLWYTDNSLTDYLNSTAVGYREKTGVRVTPVLKSGKEFLEAVNTASLKEDKEMPDLYLTTNDTLEKATMGGLASEIQDDGKVVNAENFSKAALAAVTYQGRLMAYPIYYDTSVLLYNETFLSDYAKAQLEAAKDQSDGEAAMETAAADAAAAETASAETASAETAAQTTAADTFTKDQIAAQMMQYLPTTIVSLENFADAYDAPDTVESVFKWDVADILYNYNFVGNYMNVGGEDGDNAETIDIYNADTIRCLQAFQKLNQFFSIDVDTVNYADTLQDFEDGKIVFTVAGTDAVKKLEADRADGTFQYEYGVITMPDLTDQLKSRSLSITTGLVVNGYSSKKADANSFASYMATDSCKDIYTMAGKASANQKAKVPYEALSVYMQEYADSVPMPKVMAASNLWMKLEIGFKNIWKGADANAELKTIAESAASQVTGKDVTEETISVAPETETQTDTQADTQTETGD